MDKTQNFKKGIITGLLMNKYNCSKENMFQQKL